MCKINSKFQVTLPKAIAERYGIQPGDDIRFEEAGETIRVVPPNTRMQKKDLDTETRLRIFDEAMARQRAREAGRTRAPATERGWTREELYTRGSPDAD
ncbi:MAG: AbrB/MazE/SpoVT family DNA-binding domain-containing protein [Candidatus Dadabacteria bacterium]|nr:AbrB/MazE/SpoVT family DNA-binding domain-containing protein [Candidatus Dadabacteria bacterium]